MRTVTQTRTVLFTDMVDSTIVLSRAGDGAESLRNRHFARLRGALAVHRGVEVKTTGDGLMAVFDSSTEAVACAAAMQRAIAAHRGTHPHECCDLRVGISAGEVTPVAEDFFGMPVVEASRLCATARGGQVLVADVVRALGGPHQPHRLDRVGELTLKGLSAPLLAWEVEWASAEDGGLRVALADDSVLLREAIARVLEGEGIDVVLQASDATALIAGLAAARPHVVVTDVRMPPTHTTEGLDAAEQIRAEYPKIGVLVLSQSLHPGAARRLFASGAEGVGYMLKERVTEVDDLVAAIRTIAAGGCAIDPDIAKAANPVGT